MKWLERLFGGQEDMAALPAGSKAPDFSLPAVSVASYSLANDSPTKDGGGANPGPAPAVATPIILRLANLL